MVHNVYLCLMSTNATIAEVMNRDLPAIDHHTTVEDSFQYFVKHQCHYLAVINDRAQLVGIISTLDVLSTAIDYVEQGGAALSKARKHLIVAELMNRDFFQIQEDAPIEEALDLFENEKCWALPVLSGNKLVGMITSVDLVHYFTHQAKYSLKQ